ATGWRNTDTRSLGALQAGGTPVLAITDGLSNTIAIGEDTGRNHETLYPFTTSQYPDPVIAAGYYPLPPDLPTPSGNRAANRWADPATANGASAPPTNVGAPGATPVTSTNPTPFARPPEGRSV